MRTQRTVYRVRAVHNNHVLRLVGDISRREARRRANEIARQVVRGTHPEFHEVHVVVERMLQKGCDDTNHWYVGTTGRVSTTYRDC